MSIIFENVFYKVIMYYDFNSLADYAENVNII